MKITQELFLKLYEQGKKDSEIARISGDCASTIAKLRKSLNLPTNGRKVVPDEIILELYYKGFLDAEIAEISGASKTQVMRRRNKYGLPPNKKKHPLADCFLELYEAGNNDLDISKITGVSSTAVFNYRVSLGLPAIGKHNISEQELKLLYKQGLSDEEIGKILGRAAATIAKHRQQQGLLNAIKSPGNYQYNSEEFQVILGSILGDGCLIKTHTKGGTILKVAHCEQQKEYLEYKWNILKNNASEIKHYKFYDSRRKNPVYYNYQFYTKSSKSLNKMYYNWYHPYKIIYKKDLFKLSPLGLAIWYMDDGYNVKSGGAMLCTNNFTRNDLEIIKEMFLHNFNLKVTLNNTASNLVYIPSTEFPKFKKIIEPYMIDCMKYKIEK
jgi:hypothetical protein